MLLSFRVFLVALVVHAVSAVGFAADGQSQLKGLGDPGTPVGLSIAAADKAEAADVASAKIVGRGERLQLVVTAVYDSQQERDWTRSVQYRVEPQGVAQVESNGLVTPVADGQATVTAVGSDNLTAAVRISVEQFADPPQVNFSNSITPIFTKLGCNGGGCHGKSGGQNGFALSLLGFEPTEDYQYLVREARGRRLFPAAPDRSLMLLKATGTVPHGGGKRMDKDSDDYRLLRLWIEQGMPFGHDDDPVLTSVSVFPEERVMPLDGLQQLRVVAHYSDGGTRDVTRQSQYEANHKDIADADETGLVTMLKTAGDVAVMVRYQGQVAAFQATVPLGAPVDRLPPSQNFIDELVFQKLKTLGLPPSELCDDSTFLRRVTVDIVGRLPTYDETLAFLADNQPNKRDALIDRLLASADYADFFALKWSAILRNKAEQNESRAGNFRFHDWVRSQLLQNTPYDQFVRQVIAASGDVDHNPAVNWHRHVQDINEKVEDTAQVFLGLRIQCARCHHHPFEKWSQQDYWGMAAFYSTVREKPGQQVYVQRAAATTRHPRTGEVIKPTSLGGEPLELTVDDDPRLALADWMTQPDNPFFAKALANRYWKHFFGSGIVDPEDDMRGTNPPSNPRLLDALAKHFVDSGFDLKDLIRTICRSSTYQLSAIPNEYNAADQQSFSRFSPRRLSAEVLLDGMDELLGTTTGFNGLPGGMRAVQIPDHGGVNNMFLSTFGRPAGASACECERTGEMSMAQSLQLLNSNDVYNKLNSSRARNLVADQDRDDAAKITELYYRAFCRPPTGPELQAYTTHIARFEPNDKYQAYEDILWALINTKEFMFNH